jgi:hypothetical protein
MILSHECRIDCDGRVLRDCGVILDCVGSACQEDIRGIADFCR